MNRFLSGWRRWKTGGPPQANLEPLTEEHKTLLQRVYINAHMMPLECVREMNRVFDKHYKLGDFEEQTRDFDAYQHGWDDYPTWCGELHYEEGSIGRRSYDDGFEAKGDFVDG